MKTKTVKKAALIGGLVIAAAIGTGTYLWFKPHRDVEAANAFATINVKELTGEFARDSKAANEKYLASDGNSKVLIVEGQVSSFITNQMGEPVVVLKDQGAKVGVNATFTKAAAEQVFGLKKGDVIKIKGAIAAGNFYDATLDLYENAVLVQCTLVR